MLEFNDENFKTGVLESEQPVLVVFWRPGCKACMTMEPVIEGVAKEVYGKAKVGKLNVFENPETAKEYKIPAVPTLIIFKGGKAIERAVGVRQKQVLVDRINSMG